MQTKGLKNKGLESVIFDSVRNSVWKSVYDSVDNSVVRSAMNKCFDKATNIQ